VKQLIINGDEGARRALDGGRRDLWADEELEAPKDYR
jgi:hypothetical protein